jgi:hypothetical protein
MDTPSVVDESIGKVFTRVDSLRAKYADRDIRSRNVRAVRQGDFDQIAPGIFPPEWPRPTVANLIDTMSRDFAASGSPLPSFSCTSSSMLTETARKFADKRSKIANNYIQFSNLSAQMPDAVDGYNCYGLFAGSVEPCFDEKMPRITIHDGASVYPLWNSYMRTIAVAEVWQQDYASLEAEYPGLRSLREQSPGGVAGGKVECVKYVDDNVVLLYLPKMKNHVLQYGPNPLGKCYYVCVARPSGDGTWSKSDLHGAYDDLIWPQLARNQFQMLAMEAADKSIRAPLAVPMDVADLPEGPDAIIRTNNPQAIRRVAVDVPAEAFQSMQWLERDMQLGGMTTQSRMGQQGTGWTTGRGLEQLGDGFSTQLSQAQDMLKFGLRQLVSLCFEWDQKLWPTTEKKIRGQANGVTFETKYVPQRDIDGDFTVEVTYGYAAGLDPNRALVFLLQALGAGLVSKDYVARNLPGQVNAAEELKKVELEQLSTTLLQSIAGMAAAIPEMAAQGGDPSEVIGKIAALADQMQKGKSVTEAAQVVFAPPPPAPAAPAVPGMPPAMPGAPAVALRRPRHDANVDRTTLVNSASRTILNDIDGGT